MIYIFLILVCIYLLIQIIKDCKETFFKDDYKDFKE